MAKISGASPHREILLAALQGLEAQKQKLDEQISQVKAMMGQRVGRPPKAAAAVEDSSVDGESRRKRTLSSEARKRIAAAQKKRWANFRKAQS